MMTTHTAIPMPSWKSFLGAIPLGNLESAEVIPIDRPPLRDRHIAPPSLPILYQQIMDEQHEMTRLSDRKAEIRARIQAQIDEAQRAMDHVDELAEELRRGLSEKRQRWIMLTRNLGINASYAS
jgi:hypothetical protein